VLWIKICGFCDPESALLAAELGADAIGLNFVARSKRRVSPALANRIAESLRGRVEIVGIVEAMTLSQAELLRNEFGLDRVQFHCPLESADVQQLPSWAYWAVGVTGERDSANLLGYPGDRLLVDAIANGVTGGTGQCFDWALVEQAAQSRRIVVAGGLTPTNVAAAIFRARPFGVDVAGGVECAGRPGHKDPALMRSFIEQARNADAARLETLVASNKKT
jgi:phosphoribosylanthranilate isomerase